MLQITALRNCRPISLSPGFVKRKALANQKRLSLPPHDNPNSRYTDYDENDLVAYDIKNSPIRMRAMRLEASNTKLFSALGNEAKNRIDYLFPSPPSFYIFDAEKTFRLTNQAGFFDFQRFLSRRIHNQSIETFQSNAWDSEDPLFLLYAFHPLLYLYHTDVSTTFYDDIIFSHHLTKMLHNDFTSNWDTIRRSYGGDQEDIDIAEAQSNDTAIASYASSPPDYSEGTVRVTRSKIIRSTATWENTTDYMTHAHNYFLYGQFMLALQFAKPDGMIIIERAE